MKKIQRTIRAMVLGMSAIAVAPAALADARTGFYVGVSVGQSGYDVNKDDLDNVSLDTFASQGFPVLTAASTFDDSDTAAALFGGYQLNRFIAFEVGYVNLGSAEYRAAGTVNPPGPIVSVPAALTLDLESKGFTVAAVGSVPLGEMFDLHGRLGIFIAQTELSATSFIGAGAGSDSDSVDSQTALFGAGAALHLGSHWKLSFDWTRYANVGDDDNDFETEDGVDIDVLSAGASFRF